MVLISVGAITGAKAGGSLGKSTGGVSGAMAGAKLGGSSTIKTGGSAGVSGGSIGTTTRAPTKEIQEREIKEALKQQREREEIARQQAIKQEREEARKQLVAEKTKEIIEREQKITELRGYLELEAVKRHPETIATIERQIERIEREKAVFEKQEILKTARKEWEKTKGAGKPSFEITLGEKKTIITYPRSKEYIDIQTARAKILSRKLEAQRIIEMQKEPTPEYVILKAGVEQGKIGLEEYEKIATKPTGKILPSFTIPKIQLFGTTKGKFLFETEPKEVYLPETKISLGLGRDLTLFKPEVEEEYILPYGERLELESAIVEPYKELWTQEGIDIKKGFKRLGSIITNPKESIKAERELATAGIYKAKLEGKKTDIGIKSAIYRPLLYAREKPIEAIILPFTIGYAGKIWASANVPNVTAKVSKASKVLLGTFVVSETAKLSLKYLKEPVYYSGVSGKLKLLVEPATKVSFAVLGYGVAGKYKVHKWQQEQAKFIKSKTGTAWQYQQKEAPLVVERETGAIIKTKQLQITPKKIDYYGGTLTYGKEMPRLITKRLDYGYSEDLGRWFSLPAKGQAPRFISLKPTTKQLKLLYQTESGKTLLPYRYDKKLHLFEEEEELATLYQELIHKGTNIFGDIKGHITPIKSNIPDISLSLKQSKIQNLFLPPDLIGREKTIKQIRWISEQTTIQAPKISAIPKIEPLELQEQKEGLIQPLAEEIESATAQAPKMAQLQDLKLELELEEENLDIQPEPIRPRPTIEEPIEERIITPELFKFGGGGGKEQAKPLYNVYAKERGRFIKVNKVALPHNKALNLGGDVVDNTASATFKLTSANKKGKVMDDIGFYKKAKFRQKNGLYVEMNKNRIDTMGEIQGITVKGWLAQRGGLRLGGGL